MSVDQTTVVGVRSETGRGQQEEEVDRMHTGSELMGAISSSSSSLQTPLSLSSLQA